MIYFKSPEEPFTNDEFVAILKKYAKVKEINGVPTINGQTFFWSWQAYPGIKKQFIITPGPDQKAQQDFFIQPPRPYREVPGQYSKHFRNRVKKSHQSGLSLEIVGQPEASITAACYDLYRQNMDRMSALSFSKNFFNDLSTISYSEFWLVRQGGHIISFALMLGNLMFIQSSNHAGKEAYANNFLYDALLKNLENHDIFFGISSRYNSGLWSFKKDAGLDIQPARATKFNLFQHAPRCLRNNRLVWRLFQLLPPDRTNQYLLPY